MRKKGPKIHPSVYYHEENYIKERMYLYKANQVEKEGLEVFLSKTGRTDSKTWMGRRRRNGRD